MKIVRGVVYFIGLFALCFACSASGEEVNVAARKAVTVSISPSKEVEVEAEGGELSFEITPSNKDTELKYSISTSWVSAVKGKTTTWSVEANETKQSRNANIYILDAENLSRIDTIRLIQKSVEGVIDDEPEYTFTSAEVPVFIPFRGNSYPKSPKGDNFIDWNSGYFKSTWLYKDYVTSTYFRVSNPGDLKIAVLASNALGDGTVRFTVNGEDYEVLISGPQEKIYSITQIPITEPCYVRVDMQGVSRTGGSFADIQGFRIGGEPSVSGLGYVSDDELASLDGMGVYWIMRGASTHWFYDKPAANVEYFYNEVLVEEGDDVPGSYYMTCGFGQGYMGIQRCSETLYKVLFSVWSPYATDDPSDIPDEYIIECLRKGDGVTVGEFGNEGSGGQSYINYNWTPGETYKCMVQVVPDNNGSTIYTGYFYADGKWNLIASFRRPKTTTYATGLYSFLENFNPEYTLQTRKVHYKNQWVRLASGEWREMTSASFSCDGNGKVYHRSDYQGYVDEDENSFVLRGFGFFNEHTTYGAKFTRKANGVAPVIDFDELKKL